MESIFSFRQLMKKYKRKNLHMGIIDLKKASDREPTDIILQVLDNKKCPKRLYCHHKYMYDGALMSVRTSEATDKFLVTIGLHQGQL